VTVIQCYAPTNDSDDDDKDAFYNQLEATILDAHRHDMLILMGDLNAKVGSDNNHFERVLGKEGCGVMNENGLRLVELCAEHNLVVGGSLFKHPAIHKLTWLSPNNRDQNQIDHIMVNGTWWRSLLDVKVRRGADVSSDHFLVTATFRLKLRSTGQNSAFIQCPDVAKLKDSQYRKAFVLQLKNRFQALQECDSDEVNELWGNIKLAYSEASRTVLGTRKKRERKEWISNDTWKTIETRRKVKARLLGTKSPRLLEAAQEQYRVANRAVKKSTRTDK